MLYKNDNKMKKKSKILTKIFNIKIRCYNNVKPI